MTALPDGLLPNLTVAVCKVMDKVRYVQQTGANAFHRYSYASDSDLLKVLQPAMAEHGLALMPVHIDSRTLEHSPDRKGKTQWRTDLVVTYRLSHVSGESVELQAPGCGLDGEDKGAYKAMTGALKYVLRHTFLVPTGDDAERDQPPRSATESAATPPVEWTEAENLAYLAGLDELGLKAQAGRVESFCFSVGAGAPRLMTLGERERLLSWLATAAGRARYSAFLSPA